MAELNSTLSTKLH